MRTLRELSQEFTKHLRYTVEEQNEDVSMYIAMNNIFFGRDKTRRGTVITQFNLSEDEISAITHNLSYFSE